MRRTLLNFAAAVSLVLCAVTAAWWVRSYWVSEIIGRVGESRVFVVNSARGSLVFSLSGADPDNEEPGPRPYYVWHRSAARGPVGMLVKEKVVRFGADVRSSRFGWAVLPHWILVLVTLPGAWWSLVRMKRSILGRVRRTYGHCPACGYDLRTTPERCPECGAVSGVRPSASG